MAARQGRAPEDVAYDLLLEHDGKAFLYRPLSNYSYGNLDTVHDMLCHDATIVGLGDGGAHVGVLSDSSAISYMLTHWTRDRTRGAKFPLPWAIKRLTQDSAQAIGLRDRGVVAPGYKADINVIDYDRLQLRPPEVVYDLPAAGAALCSAPTATWRRSSPECRCIATVKRQAPCLVGSCAAPTLRQPDVAFRGQSLRRLEDVRFLTGRGRFIEDIDLSAQAWMHVVRSPHAHATIERIDTASARAVPGVLGVYTATDLAELGPLPCTVPVASVAPMIVPPRHALAADRARHVGDPVAFVVAETSLGRARCR